MSGKGESVKKVPLKKEVTATMSPKTKGNKVSRKTRNAAAAQPEILGFPNLGKKKFCWKAFLNVNPRHDMVAAPVYCFRHVPFSCIWDIMALVSVKLEYNLGKGEGRLAQYKNIFWLASAVGYFGYLVKAEVVGYPKGAASPTLWLNYIKECFPIGYHVKTVEGAFMIPPPEILDLEKDWRVRILEEINQGMTIHPNNEKALGDNFVLKTGTEIEALDNHCVSRMKVGKVIKNIQGRVHVIYWDEFLSHSPKSGFWCHESSGLLYPKGWSKTVGHEISHPKDYNPKPIPRFVEMDKSDLGIEILPGMKLEAVDPINQNLFTIGTVAKVLKYGYMMVSFFLSDEDDGLPVIDKITDGVLEESGHGNDWFCYHVSSPLIFYCGFAEEHGIELNLPKTLKRFKDGSSFKWNEYLEKTGGVAMNLKGAREYNIKHGFKEGMKLEAVDLIEPALICVATVAAVKQRLLKIHFDGWSSEFDQWVDVLSHDIYPVGWCDTYGYHLQSPVGEEFWAKYRHPDIQFKSHSVEDSEKIMQKREPTPCLPVNMSASESKLENLLKRRSSSISVSATEPGLVYDPKADLVQLGHKTKIGRRSIGAPDEKRKRDQKFETLKIGLPNPKNYLF